MTSRTGPRPCANCGKVFMARERTCCSARCRRARQGNQAPGLIESQIVDPAGYIDTAILLETAMPHERDEIRQRLRNFKRAPTS